MNFERFIREVHHIHGLEHLQPDSNGTYALRINNLHLIYFAESHNSKSLYLYAPVCPIPIDEHEKSILYEHILNANLFRQNSGNAWFAIDPNSHQVLLMTSIPFYHLSKEHFITELHELVDCLSHWKTTITDLPQQHKRVRHTRMEDTLLYIKP